MIEQIKTLFGLNACEAACEGAVVQGLFFLIPALIALVLWASFHLLSAARRHRTRRHEAHAVLAALHAEICMGYIAASEHLRRHNINRLRNEKRPFMITPPHDGVFSTLGPKLSLLPASIMHRVLHYYRRAAERNESLRALPRKDYQQQSEKTRNQFTETIIDTLRLERRASIDALRAMESYARSRGWHLGAHRHDLEYIWLAQMRQGGKNPRKSALVGLLGRRRTFEHAQLDTLLEQWDSLSSKANGFASEAREQAAGGVGDFEKTKPMVHIESHDTGLRH